VVGHCASPPTWEQLIAQLGRRGYDLGNRLGAADNASFAPAGARITTGSFWVRDNRADDQGHVLVELRTGVEHTLVGTLTCEDVGPGFYDELAQFVILELAEHAPDLVYWRTPGKTGERRPASELATLLPPSPYGLALL